MNLDLTNPPQLVSLLKKHHLYTQKSFGQHFLLDHSVIDQALQASQIKQTDTVIEVGTGTGVLTQELSKQAGQVITFEIDQHLQSLLAETLAGHTNIQLHFQDFLKINLDEVLAERGKREEELSPEKVGNRRDRSAEGSEPASDSWSDMSREAAGQTDTPPSYKFVANLPYNVGSHILDILIKSSNPPQSITVLLQKEVAQKITAQPPNATYLSNFISTYGQAQIITIVPPSSFFPAPQVESALLHITKHQQSLDLDLIKFSKFLHRGFSQPRKMINKSFSAQELSAANIDPSNRPENLTLTDWQKLYATTTP